MKTTLLRQTQKIIIAIKHYLKRHIWAVLRRGLKKELKSHAAVETIKKAGFIICIIYIFITLIERGLGKLKFLYCT